MGWLEFAVVLGCALAGFVAISAVIDARRVREDRQKDDAASNDDEKSHKTPRRIVAGRDLGGKF
jgi:hypothetical protein